MFDSEYNLKLIDFGFAQKLSGFKQDSAKGTLSYMAPEIFQ